MAERKRGKRTKVKLTEAKKSKKLGGVKATTAARVMRHEAPIKGVRISEGAAKSMATAANSFLRMLGKKAAGYLEESKKSTVTSSLLVRIVEHSKLAHEQGLSTAAHVEDKTQVGEIPVASARRAFSESIKSYRVSGKAEVALSRMAEQVIRNLTRDAARYAMAAKRKTIQSADIDMAKAAREC